jgi:hypothetical protein
MFCVGDRVAWFTGGTEKICLVSKVNIVGRTIKYNLSNEDGTKIQDGVSERNLEDRNEF